MMARWVYVLLATGAITWMACGGGGEGAVSPVQPSPVPSPAPAPAPSPTPALQPTFASIRTQIFQVWCAGCHAGVGRPPDGGIRLDANTPHGDLVNAASVGKPAAIRIVPGNPNASYLVHKLEGRPD